MGDIGPPREYRDPGALPTPPGPFELRDLSQSPPETTPTSQLWGLWGLSWLWEPPGLHASGGSAGSGSLRALVLWVLWWLCGGLWGSGVSGG